MKHIPKCRQIEANNSCLQIQSEMTSKLYHNTFNPGSSQQLVQRVKQMKDYDGWKRNFKKKNILQEIKSIQNQPILHMAYRYGYKNSVNEILEEFYKESAVGEKESIGDSEKKLQQNQFQRILEGQNKQINKQTRQKLTFMGYKTTYGLHKSNLIHKGKGKNKVKSFSLKQDKKRHFPKQLQILNNSLRLLPSVIKDLEWKQNDSDWNITLKQSYGNTMHPKKRYCGSKWRQTNFFSKTQGCTLTANKRIKDYQNDINAILDNSQYILNEQIRFKNERQSQKNTVFIQSHKTNHIRPLLKAKPSLYSKYWPNHRHYDLAHKQIFNVSGLMEGNNESKQKHNIYSAEINNFLCYVQKQMDNNVVSLQQEALKFEKNSLDDRYKYRLALQKETYKRNVKSLLKCKKDHMNELKREQVRANGIKRVSVKKSAPHKFVKEKQIEEIQ